MGMVDNDSPQPVLFCTCICLPTNTVSSPEGLWSGVMILHCDITDGMKGFHSILTMNFIQDC